MARRLSLKLEHELKQAGAALTAMLDKHSIEREAMQRAEKVAMERVDWLTAQVKAAKAFEPAGKVEAQAKLADPDEGSGS